MINQITSEQFVKVGSEAVGRGADIRPEPAPEREELRRLQFTTLLYYLHETNPDNGLVRDKTEPAHPPP